MNPALATVRVSHRSPLDPPLDKSGAVEPAHSFWSIRDVRGTARNHVCRRVHRELHLIERCLFPRGSPFHRQPGVLPEPGRRCLRSFM